jgi:AcrR family transcriptional regulator
MFARPPLSCGMARTPSAGQTRAKPAAAKKRPPLSKKKTPPATAAGASKVRRRDRYHHGNLREALIEATLELLEEGGLEHVTVREAAKRAGVSSGAPFRHFPTRTALLTAVAEQAMGRFRAEIDAALAQADSDDPLARFRAIGTAYLRWALRNPTHFRVISDRNLIDLEDSEVFLRDNREIRTMMDEQLSEAQRRGLLRPVDVSLVPIAARALVYGLARMYVDGHLAQWDVAPGEAERQLHAAMELFIASLSPHAPDRTATLEPSAG